MRGLAAFDGMWGILSVGDRMVQCAAPPKGRRLKSLDLHILQ